MPADVDVHIVRDHYATHKSDELNTWLAKHPGFHVHFTPSDSFWITLFESFFDLITDHLIRDGIHTNLHTLEADIRL